MKWFLTLTVLSLIGIGLAQHAVPEDLDPLDDIDEKEFEEYFHLDPVEDPEEFKRRNEALKKNEEEIKKVNKGYQKGEKTWHDSVNEFSNLPDDEFVDQKTGAIFVEGLLEPLPEQRVDQASERYFDSIRLSRAKAPKKYDAKKLGLVSPVKNQRSCGSCVAFATMAAIETCFKKITNVFGDYSEQQLVDCGYGINGANGCKGAAGHSYSKYAGENKIELAHESQYPYLNTRPKLTCPSDLPIYNQGASISGHYYTYSGDEKLMKKLVHQHGAVIAILQARGPFQSYKGGIFAGCPKNSVPDHAITVVGYGKSKGVKYWLIKNSWGTHWGEKGYIRMKRDVNMCGIGKFMAAVTCAKSSGQTDPPMTTEKSCVDKYNVCQEWAKKYCYQEQVASQCPKSCGLCPGMEPAHSYTCYDKYSNCAQVTEWCNKSEDVTSGCRISCKLC